METGERTALIIGISGQDGSYLAKELLEMGYRIIGASRDAERTDLSNLRRIGVAAELEICSVTLNDFRSVLQTLKEKRPDEIYNLAGQSSVALSFQQPMETFESIAIGTLNLLEAIRFLEIPMRLYNAGSGECFGNTNGIAAEETTPFRPRSPYAVAKSSAFWHLANYREAYGLYACSGILFNHESPLRPQRFVTKKIVTTACRISSGSKEKLKLGNIEIRRDWGWAPEYVHGMWLMLQQEKPDDFILATGKTNRLQDFVEVVFTTLGLDWREHVEFDRKLLRPTDILASEANPSKAENVLGWKARFGMEEVASMMIEAELNHF